METKRFTQYGKFSILILVPMILLFLGWLIKYRHSENPLVMFPLYISIIFLILLLLFYQLTIVIDEKYISFKMGIGLIRRSFLLSDIRSCKPVKNYFLTGFGIRLIRNGWMYNVSGFKAIELSFYNKKSVVRIGTDSPEEICNIIHQLKGNEVSPETYSPEYKSGSLTPRLILIAAIILFFIGFIFSVKQDRKVIVDNNQIVIKGLYGITIPFADIQEVDTLRYLPGIHMKTNGYADGKTLVGYFRMADETKAKLFIKNSRRLPYLRIISKNQLPVYLNFEDKQKTFELYDRIIEGIKKK